MNNRQEKKKFTWDDFKKAKKIMEENNKPPTTEDINALYYAWREVRDAARKGDESAIAICNSYYSQS
ncbi:MAG: hypothetical protein ACT4OJ_08725 [Bacteroidota bacterium]